MSHIVIWKYYDEKVRYYFNEGGDQPTYVDRIIINKVPEFPTFNRKIENENGLLSYSSGSFRIRLSFLQDELSVNGDTVREFLFPDTYPNKFLCQVYFSDTCHFAGFFTTGNSAQALTYSEGELYTDIQVIGCLKEFADSYSLATQGTRLVPSTGTYSFETYLPYHFDTHLTWSLELPALDYRTRIGSATMAFNNQMQNEVNATTKFENISRWETFQELRKGLGFDCTLEFESPSQTLTERPDFKLKIFWIQDIAGEDAIAIQPMTHNIDYLINGKEWLFIPHRYSVYTYATFGQKNNYSGIAFNQTDSISVSYPDQPSSWGIQALPSFMYSDDSDSLVPKNVLGFRDPDGFSGIPAPQYFVLDREVQIPEFQYYAHGQILEIGLGAPRFFSGATTYAGFFVDSDFSHKPCQDYLIGTYRRYLLANKEVKGIKVVFTGNEGIDLYKKVLILDQFFYISEINNINLQTRTAELKLVQL